MSWWSRLIGGKSQGDVKPQRLDYLSEALALERQGDYDAALTSYRLALRDRPNDPKILQNMAIAFSRMQRFDEAVRHYQRALDVSPELSGAHYGLAFLLLKRGDFEGRSGISSCSSSIRRRARKRSGGFAMRPRRWTGCARVRTSPNRQSSGVGQVLAVVSQKGGVGKTTTAINLAAALALRGTKTLLLDADPQGAVRYGLGLVAATSSAGLSDYLAGTHEMHEIVRTTVLPWLRVVNVGGVSDAASHERYQQDITAGSRLADLLNRARSRGYVVIVDTPPGLGAVTQRILESSQQVLVPLQCEPLALHTTTQILRGVRAALESNAGLGLAGVLLTMVDRDAQVSRRVVEYVRAHLPRDLVLDVEVPRTEAAVEAFAAGQPVVTRAPSDAAAIAYQRVAELLAGKVA